MTCSQCENLEAPGESLICPGCGELHEQGEMGAMVDAIAEMAGNLGMDRVSFADDEGGESFHVTAHKKDDVPLPDVDGNPINVGDRLVMLEGEPKKDCCGSGELVGCTPFGEDAYNVQIVFDRDREAYDSGRCGPSCMASRGPGWHKEFRRV